MDTGDSRQYRRVGCHIPSELKNTILNRAAASKVVVSNISEGGVCVSSNYPFQMTEEVYLSLKISPDKTIVAKTKPIWVNPVPRQKQYAMGARFVEIYPEDRDLIKEFVTNKL